MIIQSARHRRETANRRGIVLLGSCTALLVACGVAFALTRPPARDPATRCAVGSKPATQTYLVVDRTDPWADNEADLLRVAISAIARNSGIGDRLTLIPFAGTAETVPVPLFDRCKAPDGASVSFLTSTPERVEASYQTNFAKPLEASIATITQSAHAPRTFLVAFLANLAAQIRYQDSATTTRIVVFSDLAENTPELSVFAKSPKQFSPQLFAKYFVGLVHDRLTNIPLEIYRLPPQNRSPDLERRIVAAWTSALTAAGAVYSLKDL